MSITAHLDFGIRHITPEEWRADATGALALPPGFWEGPGANLKEAKVTPLAAFLGQRMLGYIGIREVARASMTAELNQGIGELLTKRQLADDIDTAPVAYNLAFALVAERHQNIGTMLTTAALTHAGQHATEEQPVPVYLSVARPNPARRLYERFGFEPMTVNGEPFVRRYDYYLPPASGGSFVLPTTEDYVLMGRVLTGGEG